MRGLFLILGILLLVGCVQPGEEISEEKEVPIVTGEEPVTVEVVVGGEEEEEAPPPVVEEDPLAALEQEEMVFTTDDGWEIHGTVYYATHEGLTYPDALIILVPELGEDRSVYDDIILPLHNAFPGADVLAIDPRGQGESTNRGSYTSFQIGDYPLLKKDLEAIEEYYAFWHKSADKFYIISASMGSSVAMDYAAEHGIVKRLVMLSPGTAYHDFDITDEAALYTHRLYIAVGSDDRYSAGSATEIYNTVSSETGEKKLKTYYGTSAHGTELFDASKDTDEPLLESIIAWLRE